MPISPFDPRYSSLLPSVTGAGGALSGAYKRQAQYGPGTEAAPAAPDDIYGLLGLDPADIRRRQWSGVLTALGVGLLTGSNPAEGLGLGLAGAGRAAHEARTNALTEGVRGFQLEKYRDEEQRQKQIEEAAAKIPAPSWADPAYWAALPAEQKIDYTTKAHEPTTPNIETLYRGAQAVQGYYTPSGEFVEVGSGPRFAPQRPDLGATTYDPTALGGKGGYVYAAGPLAGKLKKPATDFGRQPSAYSERYNRAAEYYRDELKDPNWEYLSLQYARGADEYEMPQATEIVPLTGEESPDDLMVGGYYRSPDGRIGRWNGEAFEPAQ